MQQNIL
jgi:hypothetical protein